MTVRMEGLREFRAGLRADADDVEKLVSRIERRLGLGILRRVVLATPVDTGRARGNWQVDLNRIPGGEVVGVDKGGGATIASESAIIQTAKPFGTIQIANNVPYIGRLNDGYSKQAPAGFIEAAIDAELSPFE